eukprot:scaffold902_cov254-Ochromonas_danica.AAC.5
MVKKGDRVAGNHKHRVIFALPENNLDYLEDYLHHVSDPRDPLYGKHLTREEVGELTRNTVASEGLLTYLREVNCTITRRSFYDEYIEVEADVSVWEELFDTHFHEYHLPAIRSETHADYESMLSRPIRTVGAENYSLPEILVPHVDAVFNIVDVMPPIPVGRVERIMNNKNNVSSDMVIMDGTVRPSLLNSFYHTDPSYGGSQTSQAVYASLGQFMSPADLLKFQKAFSVPVQNITANIGGHVFDLVCRANMYNCIEGNLDVQYIMATGQNVPTTYYYSDANTWAKFLLNVASMSNPPNVISISYGSDEANVSPDTLTKFNIQAVKLGVMGVTLVTSSGDDGVAGYYYRTGYYKNCAYRTQFPASSPYVVTVGATMGPESRKAEVACSSRSGGRITSGGGFSQVFPAFSFQSSSIANYIALANPPSGFATSGRAYPDVSLLGNNYQIYIGGAIALVSGTSASTPVFAGMISLINAARRARNLPFLGWMNPLLYTYSDSFVNDITVGDNRCTAFASKCCPIGFDATAGWDPVTGLGSVDFSKLLSLALSVASANYTSAQTTSPTQLPTNAPTSAPTINTENELSFSSIMTLSNLTKTSLSNAEEQAFIDSFAKVLALDISYVTLSNIKFIISSSESNVSGASYSLRNPSQKSPFALSPRPVIAGQLTVRISLPLSNFPQYHNQSGVLYSDLTSLLRRSVKAGHFMEEFSSLLPKLAPASPLTNATVSGLQFTSGTISQAPGSILQPCSDQMSEDNGDSVSLTIFTLTTVLCSFGCLVIGALLAIAAMKLFFKNSSHIEVRDLEESPAKPPCDELEESAVIVSL